MAKTDFPFMNPDFAKSFMNPDFAKSFMPDLGKMFGEFKMPGFDVEAMIAAQRKNIEALTAANKTAAEGAQAVAKRQAELLQETIEEVSARLKTAMAGASPDSAAKQAELAKAAFDKALVNMRELAEIASKANSEAFELINQRVLESVEELKTLLHSGAKK